MLNAGLGLDLSTVRTGFAFGGAGDVSPRVGVWRMPGAKPEVIDRMLSGLGESIANLFKMVRFTDVAIEAPIQPSEGSNNHTIVALAQAAGVARATAHRCGARVHMVASSTVRKHFIGHGRVPSAEAKEAVVARCRALGWAVDNHDAADAAATWSWLMATRYPGTPAGSNALIFPRLVSAA